MEAGRYKLKWYDGDQIPRNLSDVLESNELDEDDEDDGDEYIPPDSDDDSDDDQTS